MTNSRDKLPGDDRLPSSKEMLNPTRWRSKRRSYRQVEIVSDEAGTDNMDAKKYPPSIHPARLRVRDAIIVALLVSIVVLQATHVISDSRAREGEGIEDARSNELSQMGPDNTTELADGRTLHRLPLFPAAGGSRQGFVRVINRSYSSGDVVIEAVDDAGVRSGPVRLTMRPRWAAHINSMDLEAGNAEKGLSGGVGVGQGDWRLEVTSELDLIVLSYARTADGLLTSLHDLAPVAEDGSHRVVFFNPGSNQRQLSKLRLINDVERPASATITGVDDHGNASGPVALTVPAASALTFTASELEAGEDDRLTGGLGNPAGRWRLHVRSDESIAVMSLLETPTGSLTNVSTGAAD